MHFDEMYNRYIMPKVRATVDRQLFHITGEAPDANRMADPIYRRQMAHLLFMETLTPGSSVAK